MSNEEAIIVLGNLPVYPDDCYCVTEYQEAKTMAIEALGQQQPCEDCISRQAAIEAFGLSEKSRKYGGDHSGYDTLMKYEIQYILEDLPSVTPKEKTGHWILADVQNKEDVVNDNFRFICSECQCSDIHAKDTIVPYCWKCGARMEVKNG